MIKFSFARLDEYAEGKRNFKKYVREYWIALRDKEPEEKKTYHYACLADKFNISETQVRMILKNGKLDKVKLTFEGRLTK